MTRKLAYIAEVTHVFPIDGADAIEKLVINCGWPVVAKKSEFKVGDLVAYFEIDSFIPTELAPFLSKGREPREYNGIKGERLRTVRLRGQVSQGLVLQAPVIGWSKVGDDLTEFFGIQKYEPPIAACLSGFAKGNFPNFIHKTDQERAQGLKKEITEAFDREDEFEVTIKLDGSSGTFFYNRAPQMVDGEIGVCSRNLQMKLDGNEGNTFRKLLTQTGADIALAAYGRNIALQGEVMGEGIQGNREGIKGHQFYVFDIWDIDTQSYLNAIDRLHVIETLRALGFTGEHVPVFNRCMKIPTTDIAELVALADGPSLNHPVREGLVWKSLNREFSFKTISNAFLIKGGD